VEGGSFDELPMPGLSSDDLDLKAAQAHFKGKRELDEQGLLTLKLLRREQGALVPTKGAVLLFGKDRLAHFSDAWIQCGRFTGTDKTHIFDHTELHEPLPQAVESILLFLKKHAMRAADLSGLHRKDVWSIPLTILREVVVNALLHADYSQRGAPIRVAFFDDRIEVENPGILLPGLTIEDMKQGVSRIRNPVIARVFRELNLIEQWGSGVRRIFEQAKAQGLPAPQIVEIGMHVRFIVPLSSPIRVTPDEIPVETPVGTKSALSRHQVEILHKCLSDSPIGALMKIAGRADRTKFRNQVLQPLLDAGLVAMTLPDKPNSRLQKYRITEKGRALLDSTRP
jgi:predicted HTH transcriptional regulator